MNRRTFVAAGAVTITVSATAATAGVLQEHLPAVGERATLSGWIQPAARGPGHYFIFGPCAEVGDPATEDFDLWPKELTLVYPADARTLRPGKATLEGRLYRGRFKDLATGHAAGQVLVEARLV